MGKLFHTLRSATPLWHVGVVGLAYWLAWLLRFDFEIPAQELPNFYSGLLIVELAKLAVFLGAGLHKENWWRHHGLSDLIRIGVHNTLESAASGLIILLMIGMEFPRSVYLLDLLLCFLLSGGARFAARLQHEIGYGWRGHAGARGLLIYGAGVAGLSLAREIRNNPKLGYRVMGFLDDDRRKRGTTLIGLPVRGGEEARAVVQAHRAGRHPIEEIVVSMPAATGKQIRKAVEQGLAAGVTCRIVPGLGELISGKLAIGRMREISVTDLLGRNPVEADLALVGRAITGQSVLVTGAAGSIGTELCFQIAESSPRNLVVLDQAESELFRLEADLVAKYPQLALTVEVGDIRDARHMEHLIDSHAVNSIFHAAAYKHVPLMERQVCEAVRNNVLGTWNLVQAAWRGNVSNFLLISSDKAVNPSSIMGLTKRAAELLVAAKRNPVGLTLQPTKFLCVRFGNVLVSNGSVVPTFKKQIAMGGPVTVTHPDMRRYFMTVQEAVHLVLQASAVSRGSEIFVLDMGTQVRIVDLAENMIKLAGFVPYEDIEIQFTGCRPGEKIAEELFVEDESLLPTGHPKIRSYQGRQLTLKELSPWIAELQHLLWQRDSTAVVEHLRILVPEYRPSTLAADAPVLQSAQVELRPASAQEPKLVQA